MRGFFMKHHPHSRAWHVCVDENRRIQHAIVGISNGNFNMVRNASGKVLMGNEWVEREQFLSAVLEFANKPTRSLILFQFSRSKSFLPHFSNLGQ